MENECHTPAFQENDYSNDEDPLGQLFYGNHEDIRGIGNQWRHHPPYQSGLKIRLSYTYHHSIFTLFFLFYSRILRLICTIWEWKFNLSPAY